MNDQFSYSNHFLQESSKTFVPIVKNLKAFLSYHIHTNELNKHEVMVTTFTFEPQHLINSSSRSGVDRRMEKPKA